MTSKELLVFMKKYNFSQESFAMFIGVTSMAVRHWIKGTRDISLPVSRLIKLLDKRPELMKEFGK